jgi:hypothetical protein
VSSGMLRRVTLVRTDVSEEPSASFIRVTRFGELGTTQLQLATDAHCEEIPSLSSQCACMREAERTWHGDKRVRFDTRFEALISFPLQSRDGKRKEQDQRWFHGNTTVESFCPEEPWRWRR